MAYAPLLWISQSGGGNPDPPWSLYRRISTKNTPGSLLISPRTSPVQGVALALNEARKTAHEPGCLSACTYMFPGTVLGIFALAASTKQRVQIQSNP